MGQRAIAARQIQYFLDVLTQSRCQNFAGGKEKTVSWVESLLVGIFSTSLEVPKRAWICPQSPNHENMLSTPKWLLSTLRWWFILLKVRQVKNVIRVRICLTYASIVNIIWPLFATGGNLHTLEEDLRGNVRSRAWGCLLSRLFQFELRISISQSIRFWMSLYIIHTYLNLHRTYLKLSCCNCR